jgi:cytoplasmic iron level regulating protein YaaA (DUF328/UPF0246 family)
MIVLLSPAKSLDTTEARLKNLSAPRLMTDTWKLVKVLKTMKSNDLQELMSISESLAEENVKRFKRFKRTQTLENSKSAIETFDGDVYRGLEAIDFNEEDMAFAQEHLRILSGLYGVLRPLDLMQEYRLEMGTSLATESAKNIYQFWGDKITKLLNKDIKESGTNLVVNLASDEYFKAIKKIKLKGQILDVNFKEFRDGELKFISFNAKKARGMMARFIIKHKLSDKESLKGFDTEGYTFSYDSSTENQWLFVR